MLNNLDIGKLRANMMLFFMSDATPVAFVKSRRFPKPSF
jgi:hypothetical protein